MDAPETIFLQRDSEGNLVTWCIDQVNDNDIEYQRVGDKPPLPAGLAYEARGIPEIASAKLNKETSVFKQRVLEHLDKVRESTVTNMLSATPYIEAEFNIESDEAALLLLEWMRTFGERHPSEAQ